jgi:hypothetical protein
VTRQQRIRKEGGQEPTAGEAFPAIRTGCSRISNPEVGHIVSEHDAETLIVDAQEIGRMINGLVRSLERAPLNRSGMGG